MTAAARYLCLSLHLCRRAADGDQGLLARRGGVQQRLLVLCAPLHATQRLRREKLVRYQCVQECLTSHETMTNLNSCEIETRPSGKEAP